MRGRATRYRLPRYSHRGLGFFSPTTRAFCFGRATFGLLGDSEFPEVVDVSGAHVGVLRASVSQMAHSHQARRQDVAYRVSK